MRQRTSPFALILLAVLGVTTSYGQFTPGRVVVLELPEVPIPGGTETQYPQGGAPFLLHEFAPDGTSGFIAPVPSTGPNALFQHWPLAGAHLTRTPNGDALLFTGYTDTVSGHVYNSSAAVSARAIGRMEVDGMVQRMFDNTGAFDGKSINCAVTNGVEYWAAGKLYGLQYMGPDTSARITSYPPLHHTLGYHHAMGLLVGMMGTGGQMGGLFQVGTGVPTGLAALSHVLGTSTFSFAVSPDGQLIYEHSINQVRKWVYTNGAWSHVYTFNSPSNMEQIAVDFNAPQIAIYGVSIVPSELYRFVDSGSPSAAVTLSTSWSTNYLGVAISPVSCAFGSSCDDGLVSTFNDVLGAECICAGTVIDCLGVSGGTAVPGTACDDNNPFTGDDIWSTACVCTGQVVRLNAKAILSGALPTTGALMNDQLRSLPSFPLAEPYTALGLPPTVGPTTTAPSVLSIAGLNAIVDWVLVELRSIASASTVVQRRAALLQRDGDITDLDGLSPLTFPVGPGTYHVAVRHRNHLGVMTAGGVALSGTATTVDFRLPGSATYGTNARRNMGSFYALWSGNIVPNSQLSYTGSGNDRDPILVNVGSTTPNNTVFGYSDRDVNLNGITSYTGAGNDRDPILVNVGSTTPNALILEQLP